MNQTAESQQPLKNKFLLDRKEHEKLSPLFQKVQLSELCKTIKGSMNDQYIDPYNKCKGADSKKLFDSKKFCNFRTETIRMVPSLDMKNTTMLWTKLNPEGFVNFANLSIVSKLNNPSFDNLFTKIDLLIGGQRMDSILPHNLSVLLALHGYKYVLEPNPKTGETTIHIPLPFSLFDNEYGGFPLTTLMHHSPLIQMDIKPDNIISACLTLHKNDTNQVINDSREWFIHQTQNTSCEVTNLKETFNIPFNHPQQMLYFCFTDDKDIIITDPKILETVQSVQLQMLENKSFQKSEKDDSTTLVLNKNELNSPMHSTSLLPGYYFINFSEMNPVQDIGSSLNFSRFEAPTLSVQLDNSALQPSWLGSFFVSATPGIKRCKIAGFGPNIFKTKSGLGGVLYVN